MDSEKGWVGEERGVGGGKDERQEEESSEAKIEAEAEEIPMITGLHVCWKPESLVFGHYGILLAFYFGAVQMECSESTIKSVSP